MKIFGLVITTVNKKTIDEVKAINKGWDGCKKVEDDSTWSAINPVIQSLKELRNNTWDVERVDHAINLLKDYFEVKDE